MFDIENYIAEVKSQTNTLVQTVAEINDERALQKPNAQWSILEIIEHVIIVEKSVMLMVPRLQERSSDAKNYGAEKLERIIIGMRSKPIKAPEKMEPHGKFINTQEAIQALNEQRQKLIEWLQEGKIIVDDRTFEHPFLGIMTIEDWMYFILKHAERHRLQIIDRMANA
jgi:DinB superfamily